jgi:RNA polymerase sigma-70 factor (ECF subfamily)
MDISGDPDESEAALVARARRGDEAAWEGLIRAHQEGVFRLAYLLLGEAAEAEDVAQETFLRAYRALDRFDLSRPLRPWLLSIAANLARNQRRSAGRYLAALQRLFHAELPHNLTVEEKSASRWEARSLWQAIQRLKVVDQQVVYLRYFLELSIEETAEAMGVAEGTVKSRLSRALTRLRSIIDKEFPGLREPVSWEGTDR